MRTRPGLWLAAAIVLILGGVLAPMSPLAQQAAKPVPPEQRALDAAGKIDDPVARLAALNKIRSDYPKAKLLDSVDSEIFYLLVRRLPERTKEIGEAIDRMKARVTPDQSTQLRLRASMDPAAALIGAHIMLDRADALLADASAILVFDTFVKEQRALAERAKQPAPAEEVLRARFNTVGRMPLLEEQGRLQLARGDLAAAERTFKDALALGSPNAGAPSIADALGDLAAAYDASGNAAYAEALLSESLRANLTVQRFTLVLARYYAKHDELAKAKKVLLDRLNTSPPPNFPGGELLLADIEARSGDSAGSLARYLKLAASGVVQGGDYAAMTRLYATVHGSDAGLEADIDRAYREQFPNPVKPEPWAPAAPRSSRLVVTQLFTGSGCGPCVAADLAMDGLMERYPADAVVALLYHVHWPRPDPMATTVGGVLADMYAVDGVPTLVIDGATANNEKGDSIGGGPRSEAQNNYNEFVAHVDKALEAPATAELSVRADARGDQIDVVATVSKLPAGARNLRLQLVLAERELKFAGENGIRFHAMVVRGTTDPKGEGLPLTATGTQRYTFKLAAIRDDIVKNLADEIARRRVTIAPNSTTTFAAEGHAMTQIDLGQLVVVAFVQDSSKRVLQAARTEIVPPAR